MVNPTTEGVDCPDDARLERVATMVRAALDVPVGVVASVADLDCAPIFAHDGLDASQIASVRALLEKRGAAQGVGGPPARVEGTGLVLVADAPVRVAGRVVGCVAALAGEERDVRVGQRALLERCAQLVVEVLDPFEAMGSLTERIAELERRNRQLEMANQDLERFVYEASHDLQQPLRTVTGFLDLLAEDHAASLDAEGQHYLGLARTGAHRLTGLFQGLLRLARLEQVDDAMEAVDLDGILTEVISDLREALEQAGAVVEHDPLPTVQAASVSMYQLFENLLVNALKYAHPDRPPRIRVSLEPSEGVRIVFSDEGTGVPDGLHERIFAPFVRGGQKPVRESLGLGFGLAIARRIAEQHGGTLVSEPVDGPGARFVLTLPANATGTSPGDGGSAGAPR
jgi:signal transduction histidine kinase